MAEPFDTLSTPSVLVDMDVVQRNVDRFQQLADSIGMAMRPHIKTQRLAEAMRMQLAAGAIGITCQKVSKAAAMPDACPEISDILLTCNILGAEELDRLRRLARRVRLTVVAGSVTLIDGLSATFRNAPQPLRVLVECNTAADRCAAPTPEQACALGRHIAAACLHVQGLMTCPPVAAAVQTFMTRAIALLAGHGLTVETVSSGGTPSMAQAGDAPVATEYRTGTHAYNDRSLVARGVCGRDDCALTVLATPISTAVSTAHPAPRRDRRGQQGAHLRPARPDRLRPRPWPPRPDNRPTVRRTRPSGQHRPDRPVRGRPHPHRAQSRPRGDEPVRHGPCHQHRHAAPPAAHRRTRQGDLAPIARTDRLPPWSYRSPMPLHRPPAR